MLVKWVCNQLRDTVGEGLIQSAYSGVQFDIPQARNGASELPLTKSHLTVLKKKKWLYL